MFNEKGINRNRILLNAILRFTSAFIVIGLLLFIPAGSFKFWYGWLLIGIMFSLAMGMLIYFYYKDPVFLEKRMRSREKEKTQSIIIKLAVIPFLAGLLLPGFDYRYGWSGMPIWLTLVFAVIMILGYGMFFLVMMQNSYASRVVEIQEGQKLIDTGLYASVRHPMYCAVIIIYLSIPFVLGSYYALIPFLFFPLIIAVRIKNEEEVLKAGLEGYQAYTEKVKYRIIPHIW